ncbi:MULTISPECIES: exopolysaccharide biosynthesis protein [Rhodomicrobium]|uniref:exopolysaccharide biosynthesis protein n=1 Tax=Rhodomicrobium TaxID=1068 RepID=UPI000B4B91C6|nr:MULTISPECIES: exopolysaccharide biosynthesis protein [Rhodomicrobium]
MNYRVPTSDAVKAQPARISEILTRLAAQGDRESIGVGEIVDALSDRSFGIIIILFALPNTILPIAWVLGTPILIFSIQMAMGQQKPWLPEFMRRQQLDRETFTKAINYVVRYLTKIESLLKPRLTFLTSSGMERAIGVWLTILTIVLLVPVPFGNALPSFGIAIIAAGLLERDGLAIIVGSLIGILGTVYVIALVGGVLAAARAIFGF